MSHPTRTAHGITYPARLGRHLDVLIRRDTILRTLYHHETHNPDALGLTVREASAGRRLGARARQDMNELVRYGFIRTAGIRPPTPKFTKGQLNTFRLTDFGRDYVERVDPTTLKLREEPCATVTSGTA